MRTGSTLRSASRDLPAQSSSPTRGRAVIRNDKNAGKLLDAVPPAQRSAGYLFAEAKYLRRAGKVRRAAADHAEGAAGQRRR